MLRRSSSSADTPFAITPPRFSMFGGSIVMVRSIFSRMFGHGFNCSPMRRNPSLSLARQASLIGRIAPKATFSCTTSRGVTRPTATLEITRSKSPMTDIFTSSVSFKSGLLKNSSTILRRSSIGFTSFNGKATQRFSRRAPIGVMVRSMMLTSVLPPSCIVP